MIKYIFSISILATLLIFVACDPDEPNPSTNLTAIAYNPTNYTFPSKDVDPKISPNFPTMEIPADNPIL